MLITEFDFTLIANYFSALDRQGPGGKEETLKALSFITDLPAKPKIADLGCGTGFQTSVLASSMDCSVIAMNLLPEMVEGVKARIKRDFLEENDNSIAAQKFVALMKKDILVYQRYKEFFGYVFFIGQKCDSKPMER